MVIFCYFLARNGDPFNTAHYVSFLFFLSITIFHIITREICNYYLRSINGFSSDTLFEKNIHEEKWMI